MHRFAGALALAMLLGSPAALAAPCAGFTDIDDSSQFCVNVEWMKNRGITLGVTPELYGPDLPVTRLQMAAFMYRLGYQNAVIQGGNAFGATAVLGTTDAFALELHSGGQRVMRYEPNAASPNLIGGHSLNDATGMVGATIGGGGSSASPNRVTHSFGTVGGGIDNVAGNSGGPGNQGATVGGGLSNVASGYGSTIAGGNANVASGGASTVSGGVANIASGGASTVAGGDSNAAIGPLSFAAGYRAKATATGSFMWADSSDVDFGVPEANFFGVRATGGIGFTVAIAANGGGTQFCDLRPGVLGWQCVSDRDAKENFEPARAEEVLAKLVAMPLFSWNFKGADPTLRNLGPTAQDFHAAFGLGSNPKTIASGNLDGVALAAIQGLNAKVETVRASKDAEIADLRRANERLRTAVEALLARMGSGSVALAH
jgi:hypothetical protein